VNLRETYRKEHPKFPWLDAGDAAGVARVLDAQRWLEPGETVTSVEKAGEGNMNLTLRVRTDRRSVVLKQSRPWVEKYDQIEAPWDRIVIEARFYKTVRALPTVAAAMPKLLNADADAKLLLLEDLGNAEDLSLVYRGGKLEDGEVAALARWAAALHAGTRGQFTPDLANREMRGLNFAHIFEIPLNEDNGIDLERFEPGLTAVANRIKTDFAYRQRVRETGARYQADGPCLVHGDYFPGSWLRTPGGPRIIDPEFAFFGDPELDIGCALAHVRLGWIDRAVAHAFLASYGSPLGAPPDPTLIGRYAGIEVMRRLIGVAQLPLPPSADGRRARALEASRRAVLTGNVDELWS
jgi:5-methylthioribose kinase